MKRVARVVVFALVTVLLLEAGARALDPALPELTTWREPIVAAKVGQMDALAGRRTDVVFAGSSQMLFAGDPTMLRRDLKVAWTSYNAGIWGAPPVVAEHWLTEVVTPRLRPKTVVLGVSPVDFVEADTDVAVQNYFASLAVRNDPLGGMERRLSRYSALLRHRKTLRSPKAIVDAVGRRIDGEPGPRLAGTGIDPAGRMPRRDAMKFRGDAAAKRLIAGIVRSGWDVSDDQRSAFRRTITKLRSQGVDVVVADMAISQPMIDLLRDNGYAAYRSFLRREAKALGVPVLDTATGVTDTRFFIDYDHLNRAGANVFNTKVSRAIRP